MVLTSSSWLMILDIYKIKKYVQYEKLKFIKILKVKSCCIEAVNGDIII